MKDKKVAIAEVRTKLKEINMDFEFEMCPYGIFNDREHIIVSPGKNVNYKQWHSSLLTGHEIFKFDGTSKIYLTESNFNQFIEVLESYPKVYKKINKVISIWGSEVLDDSLSNEEIKSKLNEINFNDKDLEVGELVVLNLIKNLKE